MTTILTSTNNRSVLNVTPHFFRLGLLLVLCGLLAPGRAGAVGSLTALAATAPAPVGLMRLLSDGTVMAQYYNGSNWYKLTPDIHGSYSNGTWTNLATMSYSHGYCSSQVLKDGRVLVAGGEYGNGGNIVEVYNPLNNSWANIPVPAGLIFTGPSGDAQNSGFRDSGSMMLPDGKVLIAPVFPASANGTVIFDPVANTLSAGPSTLSFQDEASWVKLPDDSILTIDPFFPGRNQFGTNSERYIPSLNKWISDANVPVQMYSTNNIEIGAGFLLPSGQVFFLGGTGHTVIYTPSGNTNLGSWLQGPEIPGGLTAQDAPAAMMANGKILCAVTPAANHQQIYFCEYNPFANSFSPPLLADTNTISDATSMLDLPDGTVLYSDVTSQLFVYHPDGSPLAAGKPALTSIASNGNGSYHLTGTGLNGISEGAGFGDDNQMSGNYPLVRFTDGSGNVRYGRTFNWSSTGVMTGTNLVSTDFTLPSNLPPGSYLEVVANGIGSDPVAFYPSDTPTVNFVYPTNNTVLSDSSAPQIFGYADDTNATIKVVRVALRRDADAVWYDFVSGGWGTTSFDFDRNVLNASYVSGAHTGWSALLPVLASGNYTVEAQSVNLFNASPWNSVAFIVESPPVVTFSPLMNQQVVFNFDQLGGSVSIASTVQFKIEWVHSGGNQFWNGANWTSVANEPGTLLAANLSGLNWKPAPGTLPPRFQLAQANYFIHVYATNAAGDGGFQDLSLTRSTLDTTVPNVTLDSILPGQVITTNRYLPGVFGTASDPESGIASVTAYLLRATHPGFVYWTGSSWDVNSTSLPTTYDSGNGAWGLSGPLPSDGNLINADYQIQVNAANNESPTGSRGISVSFTVDYHPTYVFTAGSYTDLIQNNENMRWDNPANWDVGSVPTNDARVVIYNYSPDNTSLGNLQLHRLDLSGGTLTTAGMVITNLNVSGGTLSGGTISLPANGIFNWSGGAITGTYNVPASGALNLSGAADKKLYNGTLNSSGAGTWSGAGSVLVSFGSVFNNSGTFTVSSDAACDNDGAYNGNGFPQPVFVNNGSLIKNTTTGTTFFHLGSFGGVAFNNNGSVDLQSGSLALGGGGTATNDSFTMAAGSVLDLANGLFYYNGNQSLLGAGTHRVSGANVTFNSGTNTLGGTTTFAMASGSVGGTNTFAGAGSFNWSGGTIGARLTLQPDIALDINGAADKRLYNGTLNSSGAGTWSGAGSVLVSFGSVFNNSGTFTVSSDAACDNDGAYNGNGFPQPVFVNNGSLIKNTTTGTTFFHLGSFGGVAFNNNGSVDLQSGSLAINGGYNLSGSPQLKLVLGGLAPVTQYSQETFAGVAALGGILSVTLTNGFMPTNGQSFALATFSSSTGQFSATQFPPLPVESRWQLSYTANSLLLQVVPSNVFAISSLTNGDFQFTFQGQTGSSCLVEVSTNLFNWDPLLTNAPFNGVLNYVDPQTSQFSKRFYRATIFP